MILKNDVSFAALSKQHCQHSIIPDKLGPHLLQQQHVGQVQARLLGGQLGAQRQPRLRSLQRLALGLDCGPELLDVALLVPDLGQRLVQVGLQLLLRLLSLPDPLVESLDTGGSLLPYKATSKH